MTELSIILPTYNERENLPIIISKIADTLSDYPYEIIVVDDNSPDLTWELALELSQQYEQMSIIRRMNNKGLSASVMEGFEAAKGKYFIVMDADLQHDTQALPQFLNQLRDGADLVIGTRNNKEGTIIGWPFSRLLLSWLATQLAHLILKVKSSDPMSGYFGIKREFYEQCHKEINPKGFKILLEFLTRSKSKVLKEVGFTFKSRQYGKSKLNFNVALDFLNCLFTNRLRLSNPSLKNR